MNQIIFPNVLQVDFRDTASNVGSTISLPAGATVFREGDMPDHMYVLLEGEIAMTSGGAVIESIVPGDSLGIVSLLDGKPRTTTALVTADAKLALLDRKKFRFMVESVPHFVWYVMAELGDRLRATNAALRA